MPPEFGDLFEGLDTAISFLLPIGVIVSIIFVIIGGYMWMTSAGNPDKIKQARGTLTWAIIGLVLILLASLLVGSLLDYFNI
jgi:type IV secretory pathway VirB2 component (pilin)